MKTVKSTLFFFIPILLTSCFSNNFIQMYKATPSDKFMNKDDRLVFEDENCAVLYDLWDEGGDMGFTILNKTDRNIYLNMDNCFYILNGIAHNYYKNRVYTYSSYSPASALRSASVSQSITGVNFFDLLQTNRISTVGGLSLAVSSGLSVAFNEEKIMCVPPKTSRIISEYIINKILIRDCGLLKYPGRKEIKTISFSKAQSPIVFSNRLAYTTEGSSNPIIIENEFYVSEITNYPEKELYESKTEEYCGQKGSLPTKVIKNRSIDKFYIKYSRVLDGWRH